ncbi:MAG: protoheme IX farnesyltransferase [Proteobacteria bacterium]|jgi:protoheme IX farnesyltransferase|nr:protoheme IX farnesyltransferase [Pseudomonadota bacterium]
MKRFHQFSLFTSLSGLFLIFAGALVTSTGSGLSVPDWPLSYGTIFPKMEGGVFYEHGHRLIAGFVASLTVLLAVWAYLKKMSRLIRVFSYVAVGAVIVQAVLGGMTVLFQLPTWISMSHAFLGQSYVCILWLITLFSSRHWNDLQKDDSKQTLFPHLTLFFLLLIFIQLFLGAWMRHIGAGLSIPDFPKSMGAWIPPVMNYWVKVHFAHRVGALCIFLYSIFFVSYALNKHRNVRVIKLSVVAIAVLILTQVTLGAYVIWSGKNAWITSFHVLIGASILCAVGILSAISLKSFDRHQSSQLVADYFSLGKPRITTMVCMTAFVGFYLASKHGIDLPRLCWTLVSVFLVSFSACSLNQVIEISEDQAMDRTKHRPLAAGRLSKTQGILVSVVTVLLGVLVMWFEVNAIATAFVIASFLGYVVFYTPLKKRTTLNTHVGAIPGALPPVIGWVAATGDFTYQAFLLFVIMFFWQMPHFLAIAWMYADDYQKAQMRMLPIGDLSGGLTTRQALLYTIALLPIGLIPSFVGMAGHFYFFGTLLVSFWFLKKVYLFFKVRDKAHARRVLLSSLLYLPVVFTLMMFDKL